MRTPAVEVRATPRHPLGMAPEKFLRDYWQKHPLLIRAAFPHFHTAITPQDLAGLACEEAALSRIVLHDAKRDRWSLRSGPFTEKSFAKLPESHWTLLVQDVDKWDMDVAALLDAFAFIPSWRIEDVMISYATDGGGVGPHIDNYDVFLVQGMGRRRWRVSTDAQAPRHFRDDAELKLLREFSPTHDWVLEPGDTLYLPPGVPHDGVALGACMTFSVGLRAPSRADLLFDLAEFLAEPLREEQRYSDPDLRRARAPGEIDAAAFARVRAALPVFAPVDDTTLRQWFGAFITRYRSAHEAAPPPRRIAAGGLAKRLETARVFRNPFSRMAWARAGRHTDLFVAGQRFACSSGFAKQLNAARIIPGAALAGSSPKDLHVLAELINAGHLRLLPRR